MTGINNLKDSIERHKKTGTVLEGLEEIIYFFDLNKSGFSGFHFRDELNPSSLLLTAEGNKQIGISIHVPQNILDFDLNLVVNMLMHEMVHVLQRTGKKVVDNKEEREWQAYREMIVHHLFPLVPQLSPFYEKQFINKALLYYNRMGKGSTLQDKYYEEYNELTKYLTQLMTPMKEEKIQPEISWQDFEKIDIRIGTILTADEFPEAKKPAYLLSIDFGPLGIKKSSAQITALYTKEELVGLQIMAVVNFPKKQIATFMSECLVMGVYGTSNEVILLHPGQTVPNGSKVG